MTPFSIIFGIYGLYKLFNMIYDNQIDKELPIPYSNVLSKEISDTQSPQKIVKPPLYNYINGMIIYESHLNYYSRLLQLNEAPQINLDVIFDHFQFEKEKYENAQNLGLTDESKIYDLIAAKEYMYDLCRYFGNRN